MKNEKSERVLEFWRGEKKESAQVERESNREGATCEVLGGDTTLYTTQYRVYSIDLLKECEEPWK